MIKYLTMLVWIINLSCGEGIRDNQETDNNLYLEKNNAPKIKNLDLLLNTFFYHIHTSELELFREEVANWFCSQNDSNFIQQIYSESNSIENPDGRVNRLVVAGLSVGIKFDVKLTFNIQNQLTAFNNWKTKNCKKENFISNLQFIYLVSKKSPQSIALQTWQMELIQDSPHQASFCWAASISPSSTAVYTLADENSEETAKKVSFPKITPTSLKIANSKTLTTYFYEQFDTEQVISINLEKTTCNFTLPKRTPSIKLPKIEWDSAIIKCNESRDTALAKEQITKDVYDYLYKTDQIPVLKNGQLESMKECLF